MGSVECLQDVARPAGGPTPRRHAGPAGCGGDRSADQRVGRPRPAPVREQHGGCQTGCFQTEEALEYCTDGSFSYDFHSVPQVVLTDPFEPVQRHEEGTWRVRDATAEPDGTLAGTMR